MATRTRQQTPPRPPVDHLERLLAVTLAAGLAASVGCQASSSASDESDGQRPQHTYDGGGSCEPGFSQTVPRCVVADADPADAGAAAPDAGPTDGGAADAEAPEDADVPDAGPADLGADGTVALDAALPSSPPDCVPDLRATDAEASPLAWEICEAYCPINFGPGSLSSCEATAAGLTCQWAEWCGVGRRPAGAALADAGAAGGLGPWLGAAAGLEAAAVEAFEALGARLASLGAPPPLVDGCSAAAEDERRHARSVRALAQRYGDDLRAWRAPEGPTPTPLALAVENRVEGCVRETFGAAVAAYQAERATDPAIARVMATVAREEAEHARLGWQIAAWLEAQLDPAEQAAVQAAADDAIARLNVPTLPAADAARAGLPDAAAAQAMRHALAPLWGHAPQAVIEA